MDSVTQIVLGAAVGELILGKEIGNKAQLTGAIAGTIPDLDVLVTSWIDDDLRFLQIHRSYSHAAFTHVILALPLAWLTFKLFKGRISYFKWYLLWFAGLFTHALLDCCTTFGTQLLLPFSNVLIGFNNISVIDPLYTVPFMILLMICLFLKRDSRKRRTYARAAIGYSLIYMAFTLIIKYNVHQKFKASLRSNHIVPEAIYTTPAMLNAVLWSGLARKNDTLYISEYSIVQDSDSIIWNAYAMNSSLMQHQAADQLKVLKWFSQGKYIIRQKGDTLQFFIVKWGRADFRYKDPEQAFLFYYEIFPQAGGWKAKAIEPEFGNKMKDAFAVLWRRIFHVKI